MGIAVSTFDSTSGKILISSRVQSDPILRCEHHQHRGREGFGKRCEAEWRAGGCLDILLAI
jgi:hypothetical protein